MVSALRVLNRLLRSKGLALTKKKWQQTICSDLHFQFQYVAFRSKEVWKDLSAVGLPVPLMNVLSGSVRFAYVHYVCIVYKSSRRRIPCVLTNSRICSLKVYLDSMLFAEGMLRSICLSSDETVCFPIEGHIHLKMKGLLTNRFSTT